mmetsp:Transcript_63408/g.125410  ORF Transcript_63408/g.125410 Transcript_63408/m.125410 type:complete len:205 (-) Transcript_63408:178-792(-)
MARAPMGCAFMAWQSERAWLAATWPKTNGSSIRERKKSTVWTEAREEGARTAQSSGASSPRMTAGGSAGKSEPSRNLAITRLSTETPTLAPQPPHRIEAWESASRASCPEASATGGGSAASPLIPIPPVDIGGGNPSWYPYIHVRSMWSLSVHSQLASRAIAPREATHAPSPSPMRPRKEDCGTKGARGCPRRDRRKLLARGMP